MPIEASSFVPTPVVSPSGHARSFEDTEAWLRPILRRVPITRVSSVAALDVLALPAFVAVTPLAKDMTTHGGKGATDRAARLSAIMEAIERVSAEQIPATEAIRRGSFDALSTVLASEGEAILDPRSVNLPFAGAYSPTEIHSWTRAFDLQSDEPVWVPVDFVVNPGVEGICPNNHTNGLASGNTITEATVHALYEVIERDAVAQHEFSDMFCDAGDPRATPIRMLDPETIPPACAAWYRKITDAGLGLTFREMTGPAGIPTFEATIIDATFPGGHGMTETLFGGAGTDLEPSRALFRAVSEVAQCHSLVMQGGSDTFEGGHVIERAFTLKRRLENCFPSRLESFPTAGKSSGDLLVDLRTILRGLRGAGFDRCIVANLTRPDLEVPVVRVIVPGMAGPDRFGRRPSVHQMMRLL